MSGSSQQSGSQESSNQPTLSSVQVGRIQLFDSVSGDVTDETGSTKTKRADKPWTSGIVKHLVDGSVMVRKTNLDGDEQADLVHHGGLDKAVLAYPQENYLHWQTEFPEVQWRNGCFGENLTLDGVAEQDVCVGDIYSLGECLLQVSQPRQPCWKLSRFWNLPKLAVRVQQTRRTGWYMRVLQEGEIASGQIMRLVERPLPQWTVIECNEVMFARPRDARRDIALASCDELSASWRETLSKRSAKASSDGEQMDDQSEQDRLKGK